MGSQNWEEMPWEEMPWEEVNKESEVSFYNCAFQES